MNDKFVVWVLAFGFIVTAVWFVGDSTSVDALSEQLADIRSSNQSVTSILATKQKLLEQRKAENARLTEIGAQLAALKKEREPLAKKIAFLTEQPDVLLGRIFEVVHKIRQQSIGRDFGDLRLPNGGVLEKAKVQKVTDTHVTIQHSGGVTRLDAKSAPVELVNLFRLKDETDVTSGKSPPLEKTPGAPDTLKAAVPAN